MAQRFHETYERLAPSFGYKTRTASAVPWADVPDSNRRLMVAVCAEILEAVGGVSLPAPDAPSFRERIGALTEKQIQEIWEADWNDPESVRAALTEVLAAPAGPSDYDLLLLEMNLARLTDELNRLPELQRADELQLAKVSLETVRRWRGVSGTAGRSQSLSDR